MAIAQTSMLHDRVEFILDNDSEINQLPTTTDKKNYNFTVPAGSTAYLANLSKIWVLSPSGVWTIVG